MIKLNRDDEMPLSEQIAEGLAGMIQRGQLTAGARLPSVRQMAGQLGVSAFTVIGGYDRLTARNLIAARPGAGYYVVGSPIPRDGRDAQTLVMPPSDTIGFALHCMDGTGASLRSGSGFLPEEWLTDVVPAAPKLLSPALRVGFVALPLAALDAVLEQKILSVLATPSLTEALVEATLDSGRFQRHVQRVRSKIALFRQGSSQLLLESGVELDATDPDGLFLWGRIPGVVDADTLVRSALEAGILLAKGQMFSPSGGFGAYFRFNVAHSSDPLLGTFLSRAIQAGAAGSNVRQLRPLPTAGGHSANG